MAESGSRLVRLEEEIDGDLRGTTDYIFCRIGEPVPLKSTDSDYSFDLASPPSQPLAVSERHRVLFVAHTEGFFVTNTNDVIGIAKEIKDKGKGPSIEGSSIVDVLIGRVSILALSGDSSILAATVGGQIHLFSVQSLIDKVQEPAFSCPLNKPGTIKDLKWQKSSHSSFIVLSGRGSLCHGSSDLQLKDVMENVDAVDWSIDGDFIAIARKDTVSIFSSDFKENLSMLLLFQSWPVDPDVEIRVDSVKWVRHDSIVVGCTQLMEEGNEGGYLIQVITCGEHKFSEKVACKPLVFSFPDLFEGLSFDMLPLGAGPYLLADYFDCWDVLLASNKKNIDQHISLLRWLVEDDKIEVVSLEFGSDKYIPRIDLQDNGDDNLILGLGVDKISLYEKIKIQRDVELKEFSPRFILLCITCDGKLTLYHAAWASEPSDMRKFTSADDNVSKKHFIDTVDVSELGATASKLKDQLDTAVADKKKIFPGKPGVDTGGNKGSPVRFDGGEPQSDRGPGMIPLHGANPSVKELGAFTSNSTISVMGGTSTALKETGTSKPIGSSVTKLSSSFSQTAGKSFPKDGSDLKHLVSSSVESCLAGIGNSTSFSAPSRSQGNLCTFGKPFGSLDSFEKVIQSGTHDISRSVQSGSSLVLHGSPLSASEKSPISRQQPLLSNTITSKPRQILGSEPELSKQFYNVKDMVEELDELLSSIEGEGGFKDMSTVVHEKSNLALEAGLENLSEMLRIYRNKVEKELVKIHQLQNEMLQVSARQIYMEGIVKQASDKKYWDIWNCQKLSPELEAKRQHILNLKQNLTNKLIELERHFNNLEINRYGECDIVSAGSRAPRRNFSPLRQTRSLNSVYNTVNSQLAAAEQLSECLSKQMSMLNITSPASKQQKVAKELFESIGLEHRIDAFKSPDIKNTNLMPYSSRRTSPSSHDILQEQAKNCASVSVRGGLESTRRRRDSLDRGWASFAPSRITAKRASKDEHARSNLALPFRLAKEKFDSQVKAFDIAQKTSMQSFAGTSMEAFVSPGQALEVIKHQSIDSPEPAQSKTTFNSNDFQNSLIKGMHEKNSIQTVGTRSKSSFNWANDHSNLASSPSTTSNAQKTKVLLKAPSQQSSLTAQSVFSNSYDKDGKFGSPLMSNFSASSTLNQSNSPAIKTPTVSKPQFGASVPNPLKLSNTLSPSKITNAAERSQLSQEGSLNIGVDVLANSIQTSAKNFAASSKCLSTTASVAAAATSLFCSSSSSNQFGKSKLSTNFLSPSQPYSSSNVVSCISEPSPPRLPVSEGSPASAKVFSELESAASQSLGARDADAPVKVLSLPAGKNSSQSGRDTLSSTPSFVSPQKEVSLSLASSSTPTVSNSYSISEQVASPPPASRILPPTEKPTLSQSIDVNVLPASSSSQPKVESVTAMPSSTMTTENDDSPASRPSQEDNMEEEAPDTTSVLNMRLLGDFNMGATQVSNAAKSNPFGGSFMPASTSSGNSMLSWSPSSGQLFRPSSFNLPTSQPAQPAQPAQPTSVNSLGGAISGGFSGFGQPAQLGAGQQALGSVLGAFGQSRQLGTGIPGFSSSGSTGGFGVASVGFAALATSGGGFASAANGVGFAALASSSGGFAGAATGGGFAALATSSGGFAGSAAKGGGFSGFASTSVGFPSAPVAVFAAAVPSGGGFAAAASGGGGFGGASSGGGLTAGGFGGFSGSQGGGFSAFGGGSSGAGRPPAELLTQMRK